MIRDYLRELESRLATCYWIAAIEVMRCDLTNFNDLEILIYRFRIKIKNGDLLEMMERVVMEENLPLRHTTYRFHWQDANGKLIRRWDNAPHHIGMPGFPYHVHLGEEMRMETSNPLTGLMLLDEMDVLFNNIDMNKENTHNETEIETGIAFTIPPELRKLRPARWMRDFLFDWAIIVATFAIVAVIDSIWIFPLAALVIGTRLHALAILAHDATHRLVFHNRKANDLIAELFITWPVFCFLEHGYRPFHFQHHRTLGTDADPELAVREYNQTWKKIAFRFIIDILGLGLLTMVGTAWLLFPHTRLSRILAPVILWGGFITLCGMFQTWWIFGLWMWSIVSLGALFRVRAITEHSDLPWNGRETSHRFSAGWLTRFIFFPHHTYCHYEHHLHPQVPYYNLPAVRKLIVGKPILPLRELFPV